SLSAIATRRTKGESYWPIRNMVLAPLSRRTRQGRSVHRDCAPAATKISEMEHCARCNKTESMDGRPPGVLACPCDHYGARPACRRELRPREGPSHQLPDAVEK